MNLRTIAAALVAASGLAQAPPAPSGGETLTYAAQWRLVRAGNARISWSGNGSERSAMLHLETTGVVGALYKLDDQYSVSYNDRFCASSSLMKAIEGKKQREIKVTFHAKPGKAETVERDLLKSNEVVNTREIDVPACVHDTIAALSRLRTMKAEPGQTIQLPISDGRKSAMVRVAVQKRETIGTPAGEFRAIRYEAFLFNDIIYRRKARLFFWLTEDERRIPVKIQIDMPFWIGNVTLELEKA